MDEEKWERDWGEFKSDEEKAPKTLFEFLARDGRLISVRPHSLKEWREAWTVEEFLNELVVKMAGVVIKHGITEPSVALEMALEELNEPI